MGQTAHAAVRPAADHSARMNDFGSLYRIEDDLSPTWVEEWAAAGVTAIETYLAKHLAFLAYLDDAAAA
jgi:hypothetical protein